MGHKINNEKTKKLTISTQIGRKKEIKIIIKINYKLIKKILLHLNRSDDLAQGRHGRFATGHARRRDRLQLQLSRSTGQSANARRGGHDDGGVDAAGGWGRRVLDDLRHLLPAQGQGPPRGGQRHAEQGGGGAAGGGGEGAGQQRLTREERGPLRALQGHHGGGGGASGAWGLDGHHGETAQGWGGGAHLLRRGHHRRLPSQERGGQHLLPGGQADQLLGGHPGGARGGGEDGGPREAARGADDEGLGRAGGGNGARHT